MARDGLLEALELTEINKCEQKTRSITERQVQVQCPMVSLPNKGNDLEGSRVKLLSHLGAGSRSGCYASHPAPCYCAWKSSGGRSRHLDPCIHMGDQDQAPDSQIPTGLARAIVAIWRAKQQTEAVSLSVSFFSYFAFQMNKYIINKNANCNQEHVGEA